MTETLRIPLVLLPFVLVLVAGCPETEKTPVDAGNCAVLCTGATPYCDSTTATCVACTGAEHCASPTPMCDPSTHTCVGCSSNDQCPEAAAPVCNTGTGACGGCTGDGECARFAATPVCDEASGKCVACTADTEAARCSGKACHPTRFECLTYPRGTRDACQACTGDVECRTGLACVATWFLDQPVGSFCLYDQSAGGCANSTIERFPYNRPAVATSVDGASATYCFLPTSTTCPARNEFAVPCSPVGPDTCGVDGIDDAVCDPVAGQCTYRCGSAPDCPYKLDASQHPAARDCTGTPTVCSLQ